VAASALTSTRDAVAEIKNNLSSADFQHIIAFFAIEHDAQTLVDASAGHPGVPLAARPQARSVPTA
jgi:hypothetical protein